MDSYLAIALILIFFIVSLFVRKLQGWRGLPFIYGALMIFFLVNAFVSKGQMYVNLLFVILALGFAIRSFKQVRAAKTE